jgi:hypothetical protein
MNVAAHRVEDNAKAPVLYMALELSNTTWKVVFDDQAQRLVIVEGQIAQLEAKRRERLYAVHGVRLSETARAAILEKGFAACGCFDFPKG